MIKWHDVKMAWSFVRALWAPLLAIVSIPFICWVVSLFIRRSA